MEAFIRKRKCGQIVGIIKGLGSMTYGQKTVGIDLVEVPNLELFRDICQIKEIPSMPYPGIIDLLIKKQKEEEPQYPKIDYTKLPLLTQEKIYPHQREAVEGISTKFNNRCMLVSPAGSGKTQDASIIANHVMNQLPEPKKFRMLFAAPASILQTIQDELLKWGGIEGVIIQGSKLPKKCEDKLPRIVITTYDSIRLNKHILARREWDLIILDECQKIKHLTTKRSQALMPLLKEAKKLLLMSATPISKCPSGLYAQMLPLLGEETLGTYEDFVIRYCSAQYNYNIPFHQRQFYQGKRRKLSKPRLELGNPRYKQELNVILDQCRVLIEVDMQKLLPKFTRFLTPVEITTEQVLEQCAVRQKLDALPEGDVESRKMLIMELWRLNSYHKRKPASRWVNQKLKEDPNEKVIIYTFSRSVSDYILAHLPNGVKGVIVDGRTPLKKRKPIIEDLATNPDSEIRVGILSFGTCSLGTTMPPCCSRAGCAEIPLDIFLLLQAEGKMYRLGAIRDVVFEWLVATDSFDEQLVKRVCRNADIVSQVMAGTRTTLDFDTSKYNDKQKEEEEEEEEKKKQKKKKNHKRQKLIKEEEENEQDMVIPLYEQLDEYYLLPSSFI